MRYNLLDSLRGFAILEMITFHLCYDLNVFGGANADWPWLTRTVVWQQQIVYLFIFVSGMSCALMKPAKHFQRGIFLNLLGLLITAATCFFVPAAPIHYGVLTFIGSALLITYILEDKGALLTRLENGIGSIACMLICIACVILTYSLQTGELRILGSTLAKWPLWPYERNWAWLGFPHESFFSSDYVPVLPHIFAFWLGWFYIRYTMSHNAKQLLLTIHPQLNFLGKHSLLIYFIHQPLMLAILMLLGKLHLS